MEIFSQPPRSFNIDRKSPFASDLKSAISDQLQLLFDSLFDDDILSEYVTVLVCNGKTQNQARDDLDAFLGEKSEAFVNWLWDFLLKNVQQGTVAVTLKDTDDMQCPEVPERRRNTSEVNSEKTGDSHNVGLKTQNSILDEVIISPKKGLLSGATSPQSEYAQDSQISGNSKKRVSSTDIGSLYCDKAQTSVWDRLSRPGKAALTDVHVDEPNEHMEGINHIRSSFRSKPTRRRTTIRDVIHRRKEIQGHAYNHNGMQNMYSDFVEHPDVRKRNCAQITKSDSSLVRGRCVDNFYPNQWHANKRSKFVAKVPKDLVSAMKEVKLRLRQMETEISKLQIENIRMGNVVKNSSSSNSGVAESTVEDVESRMVLVSNVHYAASREALSLYFAKCGRVVNVTLLSDLSSFAPDSFVRSAYITFASKESIEKALSLSGTIFYSRSLKIMKCNEKESLNVTASEESGPVGTKGEVGESCCCGDEKSNDACEDQQTSAVDDNTGSTHVVNNVESVATKIDVEQQCSASSVPLSNEA